jgi:hypothetical protein
MNKEHQLHSQKYSVLRFANAGESISHLGTRTRRRRDTSNLIATLSPPMNEGLADNGYQLHPQTIQRP